MRTFPWLFLSGCLVLGIAACNQPAPPANEMRPTATIKDLMDSILAPSADTLWQAVATVVTAAGTEERAPQTDEEWLALRQRAVALVEVSNLLLMERQVAKPGQKSEFPGIELEPEEMEVLIRGDRETWKTYANGLQDAVLPALRAIDARNAQGLADSGEAIDAACERCHLKYWYPGGGPPPPPTDLKK